MDTGLKAGNEAERRVLRHLEENASEALAAKRRRQLVARRVERSGALVAVRARTRLQLGFWNGSADVCWIRLVGGSGRTRRSSANA